MAQHGADSSLPRLVTAPNPSSPTPTGRPSTTPPFIPLSLLSKEHAAVDEPPVDSHRSPCPIFFVCRAPTHRVPPCRPPSLVLVALHHLRGHAMVLPWPCPVCTLMETAQGRPFSSTTTRTCIAVVNLSLATTSWTRTQPHHRTCDVASPFGHFNKHLAGSRQPRLMSPRCDATGLFAAPPSSSTSISMSLPCYCPCRVPP